MSPGWKLLLMSAVPEGLARLTRWEVFLPIARVFLIIWILYLLLLLFERAWHSRKKLSIAPTRVQKRLAVCWIVAGALTIGSAFALLILIVLARLSVMVSAEKLLTPVLGGLVLGILLVMVTSVVEKTLSHGKELRVE